MDKQDNGDKLSEARSSRDNNSFKQTIYKKICPCFIISQFRNSNQNDTNTSYHKDEFQVTQRPTKSMKVQSIVSDVSSQLANPFNGRLLQKQFLFKSVYEHANKLLQQYDQSLDKSTIKKWHSYSIYQYKQNELLALGTTKGRILCKINCAKVQPSAIAKKKTNLSKNYERSSNYYSNSSFDKYWNRRYMLFEKFDQGINLDDQSWYSVTPQAIAQHIASKIKCDTVLDGLCGAGGDAIKLSNTCSRVIANDICKIKLRCLQTNAKVYCVQNIQMLNQDFLTLQEIEPDVVYLAPPFNPDQTSMYNLIQPDDMKIPLSKLFAKSIQLSKNIVMLLPPNINVRKLGQLIARQYIEANLPSSTCSIKIQKIFFMSQLKYLAIYLGSIIQNQMNLNDELLFIYNYLKEGEKIQFKHKKVIKYLRQRYGMINLLNIIFDLDKVKQIGTLIQKLYIYIREKELIDQQRLQKLIRDQKQQNQRYNKKKIPLISQQEVIQQQKYTGEETEKERTLSYYSGATQTRMQKTCQIDIESSKSRVSFNQSSHNEKIQELIQRSNTIQFCPVEDGFSQGERKSDFAEFESYK